MSAPTCGAKTRPGTPCAKSAGWGTEHPGIGRCRLHGGASPLANRGAQLELARQAAVALGLPRDVAPQVALNEELARAAGSVEWLGAQVRALGPHEIHAPVGGGEYPARQPHVLIRLYQEERDRLVKIAAICVSVGVEEWKAAHTRETGEMIAGVLRGVLGELGVLHATGTEDVVRRHLSGLTGEPGAHVGPLAGGLGDYDMSRLDNDELRTLSALLHKAAGREPLSGGDLVDTARDRGLLP